MSVSEVRRFAVTFASDVSNLLTSLFEAGGVEVEQVEASGVACNVERLGGG